MGIPMGKLIKLVQQPAGRKDHIPIDVIRMYMIHLCNTFILMYYRYGEVRDRDL